MYYIYKYINIIYYIVSKVIICIYTCLYTKYIESFESVLLYKNVKCN